MKTNFAVLALAAALLVAPLAATVAATPVSADPTAPAAKTASFTVFAYRTGNPMNVRVNVQKTDTRKTVVVTLKNKDGEVLFQEFMGKKETQHAFAFDLSELEDGAYTIEITSNQEKVTKTFDVSTPNRAVNVN